MSIDPTEGLTQETLKFVAITGFAIVAAVAVIWIAIAVIW